MGVIQNIVVRYADKLNEEHPLNYNQINTFKKIKICHTEDAPFAKEETCDCCGKTFLHYGSCGNRNCPECQQRDTEEWVDNYEQCLLDDIPYFHMVFTVPAELNSLIYQNQRILYRLMFDAAKRALIAATKDDYGKTGFTFILHTWGSDLSYHPHIHGIVAGGGIITDENGDQTFKKSRDNFLVSVKVVSKLFRGKFLDSLKRLYKKDKLTLTGSCEHLSCPDDFESLVSDMYSKKWVVNLKPTFKNRKAVVNYIGRYTHRIAISNSRIVKFDEEKGTVTFKYKDYKSNGQMKEMTLTAIEFLRRFSMHILPSHFLKVRHYGFMSNTQRKTMITLCRSLLNIKSEESCDAEDTESKGIFGTPFEHLCPQCYKKIKKIRLKGHHSSNDSS